MTTDAPLEAGLYVVATPLGNLGDVTARSLIVFRSVQCIACEDTRVTRDLLRLLAIEPPHLISVREHNEREASEGVIARIAAGEAVAYASDAGTPAISDPGARLVDAVRAAGHAVVPVPGVSAVTAALSVSGFSDTAFVFLGFAPNSGSSLTSWADELSDRVETAVFFDSPHRVEKTLQLLARQLAPNRRVLIARELTKKFESIHVVPAGDLAEWTVAHADKMRGEFVLAVEGAPKAASKSSVDAKQMLTVLLDELPPAKAAKLTAKLTGESREVLYELAESLKTRK
ncbi:MAG: 16S rRNA (cytidine(1402)-2'-O)-methyltransferase [Betaproteobacteria bacterium]|nr:MAG: 16S rRNA (cytidine(1402)-2'-O)-methyltransferase [Betaproteobacteria bacterium]